MTAPGINTKTQKKLEEIEKKYMELRALYQVTAAREGGSLDLFLNQAIALIRHLKNTFVQGSKLLYKFSSDCSFNAVGPFYHRGGDAPTGDVPTMELQIKDWIPKLAGGPPGRDFYTIPYLNGENGSEVNLLGSLRSAIEAIKKDPALLNKSDYAKTLTSWIKEIGNQTGNSPAGVIDYRTATEIVQLAADPSFDFEASAEKQAKPPCCIQ